MNYNQRQRGLLPKGAASYFTDPNLLRDEAWPLIRDESNAQYEEWGCQNLHIFEWLAFITEEVGELSQAMSEYLYRKGDLEKIRDEATQVATLAIKVAVMADKALGNIDESGL